MYSYRAVFLKLIWPAAPLSDKKFLNAPRRPENQSF